jgi:DNA-3-methyladenine glycosylase
MWGKAGVAYVYLIYGMHHCVNAVTELDGYPGAVLVRAVEPLEGAADARGSGPGLVCRALRIDRTCSGVDLVTSSELFIEADLDVPDADVRIGPRVGVDYAAEWAAHPWRYWVAGSAHVSRGGKGGSPFDAC